jgi:hypothetical protein
MHARLVSNQQLHICQCKMPAAITQIDQQAPLICGSPRFAMIELIKNCIDQINSQHYQHRGANANFDLAPENNISTSHIS